MRLCLRTSAWTCMVTIMNASFSTIPFVTAVGPASLLLGSCRVPMLACATPLAVTKCADNLATSGCQARQHNAPQAGGQQSADSAAPVSMPACTLHLPSMHQGRSRACQKHGLSGTAYANHCGRDTEVPPQDPPLTTWDPDSALLQPIQSWPAHPTTQAPWPLTWQPALYT